MTTQSHYASVQTQRGYCLFIFHVNVMDGLCKEAQKERQMEEGSSKCLICIRKWPESGTDEPYFLFSITGGGTELVLSACATYRLDFCSGLLLAATGGGTAAIRCVCAGGSFSVCPHRCLCLEYWCTVYCMLHSILPAVLNK